MIFKETELKGSYLISLTEYTDDRGWFARTFCKKDFIKYNLESEWVQSNHSYTKTIGCIRGMHFQLPPYGEAKLLRCVNGAVFDVIIDLRKNSDTFLKWYGTELSAKNRSMLYIPKGFAHGFQTLENNTELIYQHSEYYNPEAESGILYNEPKVEIKWPLPVTVISKKDQSYPLLTSTFKGL